MWPGIQVRFKVWFELSGRPLLGEGGYELLKAIDEEGSIRAACRKLGLSYRKAMNYLRRLEGLLGSKVIEARRGGRGGGSSSLTEEGRELLRAYEAVREAVRRAVEEARAVLKP